MMQQGKYIRAFLILIFMCVFLPSRSQPGVEFIYHSGDKATVSSTSSGSNSFTLNYKLPSLTIKSESGSHGTYYRLEAPGHSPTTRAGYPELPVFSTMLEVPFRSGLTIRISDVRSKVIRPSDNMIPGILIPASEGRIKKADKQDDGFRLNKEVYSVKGLISHDTASIEYAGNSRGTRLASLSVYPVRYNPHLNELELITSMTVTISFGKGEDSLPENAAASSASFRMSLDKGVLNYNPAEVIPGYSEKPVGMIILSDTLFRKQLEPLVIWKTLKGFRVTVLFNGKKNAGTSYEELRDTIARIYKSGTPELPPPEYLLIIGDPSRIPSYTSGGGSGNITDLYYGEFDGNGDYIPDMYIGRIAASDTAEAGGAIRKIISYEKYNFGTAGTAFLKRALALAGNDTNFVKYMNGQLGYAGANYLNKSNGITATLFPYPQSSVTAVADSLKRHISNGLSFLNYTGHGSTDGWLFTVNGTSFYLKGSDISGLTNRNMYPLVISNACRTGQFAIHSSLSAAMTLADKKGAIAFIGCSNDSYWDEDFWWAVGPGTPSADVTYSSTGPGAYDRLFHTHNEPPSEWYSSVGQINYAGNLAVTATTSSRKKYYWETYNVAGDPSIIPYIGSPKPFDFALPDTLPAGISSFSFITTPFTYAAISGTGILWDASHASPSGAVSFNLPETAHDSCLVVLTGQNHIPLIKKIKIAKLKGVFLNLEATEIDDSQGDNNGKIDFGEPFLLKLTVSNLGAADAGGLWIKISSPSEMVTIGNDSIWIGDLKAGSHVVISDAFPLRVSGNISDLSPATINILLKASNQEKKYNTDIVVHAPELKIVSCSFDDSSTGNGNHIPDPGETFNMVFTIANNGSSSISGQFRVVSETAGISVPEPEVKSGLLKFGETTNISIPVKISENVKSGSYFSILAALDCNPFLDSKIFTFRAGKVRESFEASNFTVFPWQNASPVPWIITNVNTWEGGFAARSGSISNDDSTILSIRANYQNRDTVTFHYRVSSEEGYDFFSFLVNGSEVLKASGLTDWIKVSVPIEPGLNKLDWIYRKDNSVSAGSDCAWIDMIDFTSEGSLTYIRNDLEMARIQRPSVTNIAGRENLTVKILNRGSEEVSGFTLAYRINDNLTVRQTFSQKILPGNDSLAVTFLTRADFSKYGIYKITAWIAGVDDYSPNDTLSIELENTEIADVFSLYPNPSSGDFTIFIDSRADEQVLITITSPLGQRLYSAEKYVFSGKNEIVISDFRTDLPACILKIQGPTINKSTALIRIIR